MSNFREVAKILFNNKYLPKNEARLREWFGNTDAVIPLRNEIERAYLAGYEEAAKGTRDGLKRELVAFLEETP